MYLAKGIELSEILKKQLWINKYCLIGLFFYLTGLVAQGQVKYSAGKSVYSSQVIDPSLYPIFDETGTQRDFLEVNELMADGKASLKPLFGLDGRIERLLLTSSTNRILEMEVNGSPKPGDYLPSYIFEDSDSRVYALEEMKDYYFLIYMELSSKNSMVDASVVRRLDLAIQNFAEKDKLIPLMFYAANDEQEPINSVYFKSAKFGNAFFKLMNIRVFPQILVIGKNGEVKDVWSKDDPFDLSVLLK